MVAKLTLLVAALVSFSVIGFASAEEPAGPAPAADAALPLAPGEDCVPSGSMAAAVLAAARSGQAVRVGLLDVPPLRVSTDFAPEEARPGAGRPHDLAGPVHFVRQASLVPGDTTVAGYVKCDFVYGVVNHAGGLQVEFGERPAPLADGTEAADVAAPAAPAPAAAGLPPMDPIPFNSIDVMKHIYADGSVSGPEEAIDPINVVFYDTIRPTLNSMLSGAGYKSTPNHCPDPHPTHFWDAQHGKVDRWQYQNDEWATDVQDWFCVHGNRFHVRLYESDGGDAHNPGFKGYILAPVHQDEGVNPAQNGQDNLWTRLAGSPRFTVPPRTVIVATESGECPICTPPKWKGEVDLYEAGSQDPGNPEEGPQCGAVRAETFKATWSVDPDDRFHGLRLECDRFAFTRVQGNEWWVQVDVGSPTWNPPAVSSVSVRLNGGAWQPLTKQAWGAWAASYHIVAGTKVDFRVVPASGPAEESPCYRWIPASGQDAAMTPCVQPFDATFTGATGNAWWVQVHVTGNAPVISVDARVNCGSWRPLVLQSWGDWAASFNVPSGSKVDFRAWTNTGETDRSGGYIWPEATPTSGCPS